MKPVFILIAILTAMVLCTDALAATDVLVDGFEGGIWNANWNGAWIKATDQVHGGTASAKADSANDGMFTTTNINTSAATSITVDFWFRKDDTDAGSDLFLYFFNGSSFIQIADLDAQGSDDVWLHYTHTITDSSYFRTNFQVRFEARNLSALIASLDENFWLDDFRVSIEPSGAVDDDADGHSPPEDCNDNDAGIHPGAEDICDDGIDQDCDGQDAVCSSGTCQEYTATNDAHVAAGRAYIRSDSSACASIVTYYATGSNEPLGEATGTVTTTLYTADGGQTYHTGNCPTTGGDADNDGYSPPADCDDNNAAIHPGAEDICEDGIDQDCSGADAVCPGTCQQWTATNDAHVAAGRAYIQSDISTCDPVATYYAVGSNENLGPGTQTTTLNSVDVGQTYHTGSCPTATDEDGDGFSPPEDCNDKDPSIYPGATEVCEDGVDQDCDGIDPQCQPTNDYDNDGHDNTTDCNDKDRTIYPGAEEVCGDDIDQNCDGSDLSCGPDGDGDGYGNVIDCNDSDMSIHPGAVEVCGDGIDQDCSGLDLACLPVAPSCVYNLGNWKIPYKQGHGDCVLCHNVCTPTGHDCTVGESWGSMIDCASCHFSAHF